MADCIAPGWGTGPYGISPWAGGLDAIPSGPIPTVAPYDIYCVGPCGPMSVFLTFDEVDEVGTASQLTVNSVQDLVMESGGTEPDSDTNVTITTSVPDQFTLEYTVLFDVLPPNFNDLTHEHIFVGITDAAGPCVGLFFSQIGIAYVGGVHLDGSNDLVLDSSIQQLPDSQTLISEGEYYTVRIATSIDFGAVYIYVTKTSDLPTMGHQLKFILPIFEADSLAQPPTDKTFISVRGSLASPSALWLDSICLSSGFLIPNIPPVADAGLDQATRTCAIIQLDGTKSFDPEGAPLTFKWRLIDAPGSSKFIFEGGAGRTYPLAIPTGFTNKFHSSELAALDAIEALVAGEILLLSGTPYLVTGKGMDINGFHITVEGFDLPDNLTNVTYKYLRQNGISGPTLAKPTFLPDVPGLYKFDLIVSDGALMSFPSVTIVNVTESPVPRGIIPDLRFVWNYLSDFWKLVEDKERIEVFWGASAQVAASELLTLWQIDYSKSLRDVQRTFQRRWLHYDPYVKEPFQDLTTVSSFYSGVTSEALLSSNLNVAGSQLRLTSPLFPTTIAVGVVGTNPVPITNVVAQLGGALRAVHPEFSVDMFQSTDNTEWYIRIQAPFPFTVATDTTFPTTIFPVGRKNGHLRGSSGTAVGPYSYKVDQSFSFIDLGEDNYLVIGNVAYKIKNVISDPSDDLPNQRIVTLDEIPLIADNDWAIGGKGESREINFYASMVDRGDRLILEITNNNTDSSFLQSIKVIGTYEGKQTLLLLDTEDADQYIADPDTYTVTIDGVLRRNYIPIDPLVMDIPHLQEKIKSTDDQAVLRRNIDFFIEEFRGGNAIRFVTGEDPDPDVWEYGNPPNRLWAETTYLDNRPTIEANFGFPAEFTLDDLSQLPSTVDYLSAVRGLWYSYFKGPTLYNLRVGTQILLGLPFAEEAGTITEIRTDFSVTQGRILVQDTLNPEIIRSYTFPLPLELETNPATGVPYVVGDAVSQFAPLVTGAEILDWVKDPRWFEGILNQGIFYEVEKFFKFLVRVDSGAFNLSALLFVKSFILRIKPTYTYPLFVVLSQVDDTEVSVTDDVEYFGELVLYDGACFQYNGSSTLGVANMFDEPDPSGGGWQSQFDADSNPATGAPSFPISQPVFWGYDRNLLCPEDYILAAATVTYLVDTLPTLDSIFAWDAQVFSTTNFMVFEDSDITVVPQGAPGIVLYSPLTSTFNGTLTDAEVIFDGYHQTPTVEYRIEILVDSVVQETITYTPSDLWSRMQFPINIPVIVGNVVSVRLYPQSPDATVSPVWETVLVKLGTAVAWTYDATVPAGTYTVHRDL